MIAGGVESMSRAPFVMAKATEAFSPHRRDLRHHHRLALRQPADEEAQYGVDSMPETGENVAEEFQISRADQDAFALRSQTARQGGAGERLLRRGDRRRSTIKGRKGDATVVEHGRASARRHHARERWPSWRRRSASRRHA